LDIGLQLAANFACQSIVVSVCATAAQSIISLFVGANVSIELILRIWFWASLWVVLVACAVGAFGLSLVLFGASALVFAVFWQPNAPTTKTLLSRTVISLFIFPAIFT
jgi:hypothetical protein